MGAPLPDDPRYRFPPRGPLPPGGPVRVVEVLATGTAGGAQEHVFTLLSRIDRSRYIPSVVSLSPGAAARRIAAGVGFETADTVYYYNAGVDPDARDLSPGVVMVALYVRDTIERGKHRLDFLRGDEPYKYEWGAVDEPIRRILVTRR